MYEAARQILSDSAFTVREWFELPARAARYSAVPGFLFDSPVGRFLHERIGNGNGLWTHQAIALELLGQNKNVVIPTGTASGKSLIFRSLAFHRTIVSPDSRVVVFYPLKALLSDQLRGWKLMAAELGLPDDFIERIDGSVSTHLRERILNTAKIVLMTPDVCHAWLMSKLSLPDIKRFVASIDIVVMDEAHTLEGVFGSNFAFFLRRLLSARQHLRGQGATAHPPQLVAATATILNPSVHLSTMTGTDFVALDESADGSPQCERMCAHVIAPSRQEMEVARLLHERLLEFGKNGGFITFVDSRKGVELLARPKTKDLDSFLVSADVLPYRAGYDAEDRAAIERRLQNGSLRGVVATSALELGIDLPHLAAGVNVGVPVTRKAYRQRLGRVGRSSPGAFLVVAAHDAFSGFGTSFREYHDMSVEESYLYLDNRFMQFAHARCLADEMEAIGASAKLPASLTWPDGFPEVLQWAKPGGGRPPSFDGIAQLGGDSPHHGYPLRNVGEINYKIGLGPNAPPVGEVNEAQALRECYPGGTYLHLGRAWEIQSWQSTGYSGPLIRVKPGSPARLTRPRIRTWINAGITAGDLMEGHLVQGTNGFLAECLMQVTEKVEGFEDVHSGTYRPYSELRQINPNFRPRIRNFRTSGVILCIEDTWFRSGGAKQRFADRFLALMSREYSISPQDIGASATNISVRSPDGGGPRGDCVVIFDQTYGSLRLTERAFLNFHHLLRRLELAAATEDDAESREFSLILQRIATTVSAFDTSSLGLTQAEAPIGKHLRVFTPGSRVSYRQAGKNGIEVEVIGPTIMEGQLMYQIICPPKPPKNIPVKNWVAASHLDETAGDGEWDYAWWNSETEAFEEPDEMDEDSHDSDAAQLLGSSDSTGR